MYVTIYRSPSTVVGVVRTDGTDCYDGYSRSPVICSPSVCSCVLNNEKQGTEFSWTINIDKNMDQTKWYCDRFEEAGVKSQEFTLTLAGITYIYISNV